MAAKLAYFLVQFISGLSNLIIDNQTEYISDLFIWKCLLFLGTVRKRIIAGRKLWKISAPFVQIHLQLSAKNYRIKHEAAINPR